MQRLTVTADPGRLDQVLANLVANAIRHTPAGGSVTLDAERVEDTVRITVADTGAGIAAEDLPYLFDRFWRGDRSRTRSGDASTAASASPSPASLCARMAAKSAWRASRARARPSRSICRWANGTQIKAD